VTVHFIGAGPGAADLLTVRAVRLIQASPVCVYAGTYLGADVLAHCPPEATLIDSQHLDLDEIIGQPTPPGRTLPGCAPATRRCTPHWLSRPGGSMRPACRGT
jgi:hypothetical protein